MTTQKTSFRAEALLLMSSILITLLVGEAAYRIIAGQAVFQLVNFRTRAITQANLGGAIYDPDLGWALRPGLTGPQIRTLQHGVRVNHTGDTTVRTGGILAVGDSFTAGSEVDDHESWPAQLERIIGQPVINAGVGGYGTDQIIMQAERMLPIVRPKVLLVGFLSQDILRSGFSKYGAPKPYYTVDDGRLILRNVPAPLLPPSSDNALTEAVRSVAAYSFIAHQVMMKLSRESWISTGERGYTRVDNDPVDVTCRLLQRLKRRTDALGVRTLLVMQYGSDAVRAWTEPSDDAVPVTACAQAMGIQSVDEFASLKAVYKANPEELKSYYVMSGTTYGHMSARGNHNVAALIADALARPAVAGRAEDYIPERMQPGDGTNLLRHSESLKRSLAGTAFVSFSTTGAAAGQTVYRLAAAGAESEHYASLLPSKGDGGPYTVSLYAKSESIPTCLRVQLYDRDKNGVLADFDLARASALANPLGAVSSRRASVTPADNGWLRLSASVRLRAGDPQIVLQLLDNNCASIFAPKGEAVLLRALQLERGQSASIYQPSSGPGHAGFIAGDGKNRIARVDELEAVIGPSPIAALVPLAGTPPGAYRLEATGPAGEHYLVIGDIPVEAGPVTLALEARAAGTTRLRLQILDDANSGTIGDFDLAQATSSFWPVGASQASDADIEGAEGTWQRVTVTAQAAGQRARILLQVMGRDGGGAFAPEGEAVELRAFRLERGHAIASKLTAAR
jgi:hypothetical protein